MPETRRDGAVDERGLRTRVVTKNGWAIPHAVVTVADLTGRQIARAQADAEGVVRTDPLPPGSYTAIITAVGYAPSAATAMVGRAGSAELGKVTLERRGGTELPPPGPWTIDPAHSSVIVTAQHLGLSSVHARFEEFGGRIDIAEHVERARVAAEIKAASVDTVNKTRDDHLRSADFLDVERFPVITYIGTRVVPAGDDRWTVHGELGLKDVRRPVELDLAYLGTGPDLWGGTRAAFRATTELKRADFAIVYNQVLSAGIGLIGTTLRVELDIQAVQGERLPEG
ncbi:YceI family protein [Actinomadura sp. HBU206391]|uniref:YceI family protein n=1 Tax=Actinomadura sp. HBU206391 TaxID=2731692 RepID=UPI001650CE70|nr:YceI family protein [Actinomadura sp. HBU206391]MBC6459368.1 YceI family protein [Actinomadura sp. HBU206391]